MMNNNLRVLGFYLFFKDDKNIYFFVAMINSVISENINAIASNTRYPKNSSEVPVIKKPIIIMITAAHIPAIIIFLLCILSLG